MKHLKFFLLLLVTLNSFGQADSIKAPFLQFPFIPQFKVYTAPDSTLFTREDLPKKRPVIIMIFDPDCDHCQHQVRDMITDIDKLKKYQILMITWLGYDRMLKMYNEMNIASYPNMIMARDPKAFFFPYYSLKAFPGVYLYDKKHKLVKNFESNVKIDKLLE